MGCRPSKADDPPLVIRCRERKRLIKAAVDARYDLSSSHLAYFHSLKDIGYALSVFVDEQLVIPSPAPSSPVLTLPSSDDLGKRNNKNNNRNNNNGSISSTSNTNIHSIDDGHGHQKEQDSDSNSDASDPHFHHHQHHHDTHDDGGGGGFRNQPPLDQPNLVDPYGMIYRELPSHVEHYDDQQPYGVNMNTNMNMNPTGFPIPDQPYWGQEEQTIPPNWGEYEYQQQDFNGYYNGYGNSNQYASYMRKSAPASHTVIQNVEARGFQETGQQWANNVNVDVNLHPPPYDYYTPYQNGGMMYGFSYGNGGPPPTPQEPKTSPPPPPPPPPPVQSDYFNFFDGYDNGYGYGYGSMGSSPDSSEVREREGIPDLEEETETESHSEQVFNENQKRNSGETTSRSFPKEDEAHPSTTTEGTSGRIPSENNDGPQSVDNKHSPETVIKGFEGKKGVSFDIDEEEVSTHEFESSMLSSLTTISDVHGSRDLEEVVNEIKDEFDVAFGVGKEVALMLEAGKLPYQSRFAVLKVLLSRIVYPFAPSLASSDRPIQSIRSYSRVMKLAGSYSSVDGVSDVGFANLSSTLEKLYVWEKRLYKEVKDEERLRLMYEKMCKRLNELDAHGAEPSKIDATRTCIRRLLTKLNVSIKAIDGISSQIHKVRDKELHPQVSELIYGLIRMWQSVVKCHRKQFEAMMESRSRSLRANTSVVTSRAVLELEAGLVRWCHHFNNWINAQKSYVDSLNGWLLNCIDHKPEVTIDGEIPYSPGRIGAPPIFVICNDWQREIKGVSHDRVSKAIHGFASSLRQLVERQDNMQRLMLKKEDMAKDFARKRQKKKKTRDTLVDDKTGGSMVPSDGGVDLDSLGKQVEEEWEKHKKAAAMKLVDDNGGNSTSLQGGVIPIFKALESFTCDALKAHEQVRLQQQQS